MTTVRQALSAVLGRLKRSGVPDGLRDARILLAYAMGQPRDRLSILMDDDLTPGAIDRFETAIAAREARQPVAQITGTKAFYGHEFEVTRDVLVPRPETELVVELALQGSGNKILDLGVGSGCILLSVLAARPMATGVGIDVSLRALEVAQRNAQTVGVSGRAEFRQSNWFDAVGEMFDLIVSNPPYIDHDEMAGLEPEVTKWEPEIALVPGDDALAAYRVLTENAGKFLTPGGRLIVEIGATQAAEVQSLFTRHGFGNITCHKDLSGHHRVISGQM